MEIRNPLMCGRPLSSAPALPVRYPRNADWKPTPRFLRQTSCLLTYITCRTLS